MDLGGTYANRNIKRWLNGIIFAKLNEIVEVSGLAASSKQSARGGG